MMAVAVMAACGDKDKNDGPVKLTLEKSSVSVEEGKTTTVNITKGNGGYTVTSDAQAIATASVSGTTITVTGVAKGTANVTVKDKENKTATLAVTVTKEGDGGGDFTSAITTDGTFADWTALGDKVTTFVTNANAPYFNDLKVLKLYAEKSFLNVYMEFSKDVLKANSGGTTIHMFIDADGEETGYINTSDVEAWFNYVLEGSITSWEDETEPYTILSYDPTFYVCPESGEWPGETDALGAGFTTGGGVQEGDIVKYEFQIIREMLPKELPATIHVFFDVQRGWNASGILPIDAEGVGQTFAWEIGSGN